MSRAAAGPWGEGEEPPARVPGAIEVAEARDEHEAVAGHEAGLVEHERTENEGKAVAEAVGETALVDAAVVRAVVIEAATIEAATNEGAAAGAAAGAAVAETAVVEAVAQGGAGSAAAGGAAARRALTKRAGVVALGTLASRVLGLGRDMSMAALFPVAQTDAFWVAFTLPNALRQLLAEGAVSSAVVPVLAEVRAREGEGSARLFFAKIRGLSALALGVVTVAGVLGAPWLVELFAGGLAARPEQLERTITLTRVVFPYIVFMGTAALGMAALHTAGRFAVASFAPMMLNVALILAAFLLPGPLRDHGIDPAIALGIGALVGGLFQVLCQWPSLRAIGYAARPRFDLADPWVRKVLTQIAPMTLGLGIYYVDLVVCRRLLSGQGEGAQSYFSWAQRLCDFPQGIFVMALSAAALPSLAKHAAENDHRELSATFAHGMRLSLFVAIPVTALFVAMPGPLVAAMFQRGEFGETSVQETARSLVGQGLGLWTVAAVRQMVPVFFALKDTRTPVLVSGIDLMALIALAYGLAPRLGHVGVSLAVSGSSFVQMVCLWVLLARKLPSLHGGEILGSALRTVGASAAAGVGAAWIGGQLAGSGGMIGRLGPALAGMAAFGLIFVITATLAGSEELDELLSGMLRKLGRAKARR